MKIDGIPIPKNYKSPLQERGESETSAPQYPIPTRKDFIDYVQRKPATTDDAYIYGRFIWKSDHVVGNKLRLARIHLTDLFAPETPSTLKAPYSVDKDLMTGTIWVSDDTTPELPVRGQKVKILDFTKPLMYRNECCQFTTRYQDLWFEQETTKEQVSSEATKDDDKPKDIIKRVAFTPSKNDVTNEFPKLVASVSSKASNTNDLPEGGAAALCPSIAPTKITHENAEPHVKLEPDPQKSRLQ